MFSSYIRYEGLENFKSAQARGRGVLVATAHLGNWELSAFAHAWMTAPMSIVVRPLDHPGIDRLVEQRRALSGNRIIEKKDAARGILRSLAANEAVGILIDQNTSPDQGVFVKFFGVQACAGSGVRQNRAPQRRGGDSGIRFVVGERAALRVCAFIRRLK